MSGSWSCPMITVPAACRSDFAVAAGPITRLATSAAAPATSKIERLRMYSLHVGLRPAGMHHGLRLCGKPVCGRVRPHPDDVGPPRETCRRHGQVQDHTL